MRCSVTSNLLDKRLPSCGLRPCYNPLAMTLQALFVPYQKGNFRSALHKTLHSVCLPSSWTCTHTPISQQVACYSASEIAISMSCHQLTLLAHPRTPSESTKSSLGNCLLKSGVKSYNASCPGRYNSTSPTKVLILQLIPQWLINFWQALVWKLWWSFPESQYHLSNISNHNRRQRLVWLPKAGFTMS